MIGGCSVLLDGTNDWVNLGTVAARNFTSSPFTVMCWIYPMGAGSTYRLLQNGTSGTNGYSLRISSTRQLVFGTSSPTETTTSSAASAIATNVWQHVAAVRDGSSATLYINGEDVTASSGVHSNPASGLIATAVGATVGGGANFFPGAIDEPAFFNVALTQQQIREYMWQSISASAPGLVSLHHFNDGLANFASTTAAVTVGGVNGTLSGGATWVFDRWAPWVESRVSATGSAAPNSATLVAVPGTLRNFIPRISCRLMICAAWDFILTTAGTGTLFGQMLQNGSTLGSPMAVNRPATTPLLRDTLAQVLTTEWTANSFYSLEMAANLNSPVVSIRGTIQQPGTGYAIVAHPIAGTW